jgi:16S rRNA G966 N2-methylase RsmD
MKKYYSLFFLVVVFLLFVQLPEFKPDTITRTTDLLAAEGYVAYIVNSQETNKKEVAECSCNGTKYVGDKGNLTKCPCGDNCACKTKNGTGQVPSTTLKTVRVPVAGTGWAKRPICSDPNCAMCYTQYQNQTIQVQNSQASSPTIERDKALAQLHLTQNDVFADIGCGDGNVLIEAVKRYGVRSAIGIEIDPIKANEARLNVRRSGLDSRIQIIEADATKFSLREKGVTAAYVYLYPDVLATIDFSGVQKVVSVYHDIPNLNTEKVGSNYVLKKVPLYAEYYIIKFTAPWCGPCKIWDTNEKKGVTDVGVRVVEIDHDANQDIISKYNIKSLPSFMICDVKEEKIRSTLTGYQSSEFLLKKITELSNGLK